MCWRPSPANSPPTDDDAWAVQRDDGSWLMDGLDPGQGSKDQLALDLPDEDRGRYNTLAGMVMLLLGDLPRQPIRCSGSGLALRGRRPRRQRVDKVLVTRTENRRRGYHSQPAALAARRHRPEHRFVRMKVLVTDWSVASRLNSMFVAATEFADAAREFYIVFVRRARRRQQARDRPSSYWAWSPRRTCSSRRVPAPGYARVAAFLPFCIGRLDDQRFAISSTPPGPGVSAPRAKRLFTARGEATPMLESAPEPGAAGRRDPAHACFAGGCATWNYCARCASDATPPGGDKLSVDGFPHGGRTALAVPDAQVLELSCKAERSARARPPRSRWARCKLLELHLQRRVAAGR